MYFIHFSSANGFPHSSCSSIDSGRWVFIIVFRTSTKGALKVLKRKKDKFWIGMFQFLKLVKTKPNQNTAKCYSEGSAAAHL